MEAANKKSPNIESWLKWFSISLVLSAVFLLWAFVVSCLVYFPSRAESTSLQDLAHYGDFFGGIVGTIVSIASLGVTIYLAVILHKIERENNESAIVAQRKLSLMQLKFQEVSNFKSICDDGFHVLADYKKKMANLKTAYSSIHQAICKINTMFPELKDPNSGIDTNTILEPLSMVVERRRSLKIHNKPEFASISSSEEEKAILNDMRDYFNDGWEAYVKIASHLSKWAME